MKIIEILNGHINVVLGINSELSQYRIKKACKQCKVSYNEKNQYTGSCLSRNGGCGCLIKQKTSLTDAKCPLGIWYNETIDYDKLKEYAK